MKVEVVVEVVVVIVDLCGRIRAIQPLLKLYLYYLHVCYDMI